MTVRGLSPALLVMAVGLSLCAIAPRAGNVHGEWAAAVELP